MKDIGSTCGSLLPVKAVDFLQSSFQYLSISTTKVCLYVIHNNNLIKIIKTCRIQR